MNCTIPEITSRLLETKKCLILIHTCPDADTIGAGLALMVRLRSAGKIADVVADAEIPSCFDEMYDVEEIAGRLTRRKYDAYIAVDCAMPFVMGVYGGWFTDFDGVTVNIDHHAYNSMYAQYNCVIPCSSCCELMTEIFRSAGWEPSKEEANLLLMGMVSDSGRFSHANVTEKTLLDAAYLVGKGADPSWIHDILYGVKAAEIDYLYKSAGIATKYYCDDRIAVFCLSDRDIECSGADRSVTDGMENFLLGMKPGTEVAVFLKEQEGGYWHKAFMKSKTLDLRAAAKKLRGECAWPHVCTCIMTGYPQNCTDEIVKALSDALDAKD
ncbi:MAG: DHH family phosphoesterase [Clostridia bacterium]|nr:DHH family phosphoesterase [Clostridia bacterium]